MIFDGRPGTKTQVAVTEEYLSTIEFAEELGDVHVWSSAIGAYRNEVMSRGTLGALRLFRASEERLTDAKHHEELNGEGSLLRLDHPFNLEFRDKSPYIKVAYERYNVRPVEMSGSGSRSSVNEITSASPA